MLTASAGALLAGTMMAPAAQASGVQAVPAAPAATAEEGFDALVFSKTAGFRHDSIPAGIAAIEQLGAEHGFTVERDRGRRGVHRREPRRATTSSSGCPPPATCSTPSSRPAFEDYIAAGGGYAGVHAASDTEYDWPWYGELVGAYFDNHPRIQDAQVDVADHVHPSTAHLPATWTRTDEWYNFRDNPRGDVHVLADPRRDDATTPAATHGRRPPDRLVPGRRRRPLLVHRRGPHGTRRTPSRRSSSTCSAASAPPPAPRTPTAARPSRAPSSR